jgi:hypothetical protein
MANSFFKNKFSAGKIDGILQLWAELLAQHGDVPPFLNHQELYDGINSIPLGCVPWESFSFAYDNPDITPNSPKWMTTDYTIWYHNPRQLFLKMLQIPISPPPLTMLLYINMIKMEPVDMRILCPETGHGNMQYVKDSELSADANE